MVIVTATTLLLSLLSIIMAPKAMKSKNREAANGAGDDDDACTTVVVMKKPSAMDPAVAQAGLSTLGAMAVKVPPPPQLNDWLQGRIEWQSTLGQAFRDWQTKFKNANEHKIADRMEEYGKVRGPAKEAFLMRLATIENPDELDVDQKHSIGIRNEMRTSSGWMTQWEIWDLKKIPICKDTEGARQDVLKRLKHGTNDDGDDIYLYTHKHLDSRLAYKDDSTTVTAKKKLKDSDDHNAAVDAISDDWDRMQQKAQKRFKGIRNGDENDGQSADGDTVRPSGKGQSKGRGKGRGRGGQKKSTVELTELMDDPDQKARTELLVKKNAYCKRARNVMGSFVKELESSDQFDAKFKKATKYIGKEVMLTWSRQKKQLADNKRTFKNIELTAQTEDPHWHQEKKAIAALEVAAEALQRYRQAKANCEKSIKMAGL